MLLHLYLESNSLKWGANLPAELAAAVCGVDHLPGIALGPGWKKKKGKEKR